MAKDRPFIVLHNKKNRPVKTDLPSRADGFELDRRGIHTLVRGQRGGVWPLAMRPYRSVLIDRDGMARSWGLPKFHDIEVDRHNREELDNILLNKEPVDITHKFDGRLIIRGWNRSQPAFRTRNSHDLGELHDTFYAWGQEYAPALFDENVLPEWSVQMEWCDPERRVVIQYSEASLFVIGATHNKTGKMASVDELDSIARRLGLSLARAYTGRWNSVEELTNWVNEQVEGEGVVVRFSDRLLRIKTPQYRLQHALRFDFPPSSLWRHFAKHGLSKPLWKQDDISQELHQALTERVNAFANLNSYIQYRAAELQDGVDADNAGEQGFVSHMKSNPAKAMELLVNWNVNRLCEEMDTNTIITLTEN